MKGMRTLVILAAMLCAMAAQAQRVDSTRRVSSTNSTTTATQMSLIDGDESIDSLAAACDVPYLPGAIELKGYNKRLSDRKETFYVTNRSNYQITRVTVKFRYRDMDGKMIHEQTVNVECNVGPGETHQATIASFDKTGQFYYYGSTKPHKSATPYKVEAHIVGYEIFVKNPAD